MTALHCAHLKHDIEQYERSVEVANKTDIIMKMVDKAISCREIGRYFIIYGR